MINDDQDCILLGIYETIRNARPYIPLFADIDRIIEWKVLGYIMYLSYMPPWYSISFVEYALINHREDDMTITYYRADTFETIWSGSVSGRSNGWHVMSIQEE
jgi:hypothetical protein